MNYWELLKNMRLAAGLSLREWGDIVGVGPTVVHKIEHGTIKAPVEKISLWCKACDIKIVDFFAKTNL